MENEIWKDIVGFEEYYQINNTGDVIAKERVSWNGKVYVVRKRKKIKSQKDGNGYVQVPLSINKKQKRYLVHRLVATAFIPNPENKPQVNHINGIKTDNFVKNLEWSTRSENVSHSFKIGLQSNKGEKHPTNILTESLVKEIRSKYIPNIYSTYRLAKEYGVSRVTISDVIKRRSWDYDNM